MWSSALIRARLRGCVLLCGSSLGPSVLCWCSPLQLGMGAKPSVRDGLLRWYLHAFATHSEPSREPYQAPPDSIAHKPSVPAESMRFRLLLRVCLGPLQENTHTALGGCDVVDRLCKGLRGGGLRADGGTAASLTAAGAAGCLVIRKSLSYTGMGERGGRKRGMQCCWLERVSERFCIDEAWAREGGGRRGMHIGW